MQALPVQMLKLGKGTTHHAYLWAYALGAFEDTKALVYDFRESRAGEHARNFLGDWKGALICDDFAGYKTLIAGGVTEASWVASRTPSANSLTCMWRTKPTSRTC